MYSEDEGGKPNISCADPEGEASDGRTDQHMFEVALTLDGCAESEERKLDRGSREIGGSAVDQRPALTHGTVTTRPRWAAALIRSTSCSQAMIWSGVIISATPGTSCEAGETLGTGTGEWPLRPSR